ncbi:MAG: amidase [Frankiales bacterium]|nr:amidase [Frankiales bacterium]
MTAPHDLTVVEQRDALRSRQISAVELTEHYLGRIDKHEAQLGAFVERTDELARQEARTADARLAAGDRSALLGVPTAFKDLSAVAGVPVHLGSARLTLVPEDDGPVVGRLRRAGVVTTGTTHAPELGPTCFTDSAVVGRPAVTPYDPTRYASGSSGGAAAAVAAGLVPFAHGSDGAGSLRTPAAVCGLVGVKPSRGLVPAAASFLALGVEGPLTRTVLDAAVVLDVLLGSEPATLYGLPRPGSLEEALRREPGPLRVLRFDDSGLDAPCRDTRAAVDRAFEALVALGHEVVDGTNPVPWDEALVAALQVVVTAATAAAARVLPGEAPLAPYTQWCVEQAARHSAADFVAAQGVVARAAGAVLAATAAYDLVLSPVTAQPAVPVGWFDLDGPDEVGRRMLAWSAYTPFANLTGVPALSLPLHTTEAGLPVGVQLSGARPGDETVLLQAAAQLERALPFAHRHPAQW